MIRTFKHETLNDWDEIRVIDDSTGEFTQYNIDRNSNKPFGQKYKTTVTELGYKNAAECIRSLKQRKVLGKEI